jgi:hypothetical protein
MKRIEIRYFTKLILTLNSIAAVLLVAGTVYNLCGNHDLWKKVALVGVSGYILLKFYKFFRNFRGRIPLVIISQEAIICNNGPLTQTFLWKEIIEVSVLQEDKIFYLFLKTKDIENKINLSWTDAKISSINALLDEYKINSSL